MKKTMLWLSFFLFGSMASAQITVSGVVQDDRGETMVGVNIIEKGTLKGTTTDLDGRYSLEVASSDAVLQFSSVGMSPIEIKASEAVRQNIITLSSASQTLNQVVVVGYGSQTKKELTGSISSISSENFNKGIQNNPMGLLQGKVAGLNIIKNGGDDPAQNSYKVQLRGIGSLSGNAEPLYIIDGVPGGNLNSVLPEDIESIDVLKDGSAAAIYGTRANHGVILITTKRGHSGETTVEYNGDIGFGVVAKRPRMLNSSEYREYMIDKNRGVEWGGNTDWINQLVRMPMTTSHALSIAGGGKNFNYRGSIGYKALQGVAIKSDYQEINARLAADQSAFKNRLHIAYNLAYTSNKKKWADYDVFDRAMQANPTIPLYSTPDNPEYEKYGGYFEINEFGSFNPVARVMLSTKDETNNVFLGSVNASLDITDWLTLATAYSIQDINKWNGNYYSRYRKGDYIEGLGKAELIEDRQRQQITETTLRFLKSFGEHSVQALLGYSYQSNLYYGDAQMNTGFPLDNISYNSIGMGTGIQTGDPNLTSQSSYRYEDKMASFFGRVLYNWNEMVYFNASLRAEGSSKFGPKASKSLGRWGMFPAVSASWRITQLPALKNNAAINDLKVRIGYGITGNQPSDHYLYLMRVGQTGSEIFLNGEWIRPWGATNNENEYLKWEKKSEYNIGLDFVFLNFRLSGTIDAYLRHTTDLLWEYNVPSPPYPYGTMWANYGELQNKGIELTLNGVVMKKKDFVWNVGFIMAANANKVIKITGGEFAEYNEGFLELGNVSARGETGNNVMRLEEGKPVGNFYGYDYAFIGDDGIIRYWNKYGGYSPAITLTSDDVKILGNANPYFTYGLNTTISYKWFDLYINFRGQVGGLIFNEMRYIYENTNGENVLLSAVDPNAAVNKNNVTANIDWTKNLRRFSSLYLENASYLKLSDISLSFSCPLSNKVKRYMTSLKFRLTATNVFTITAYSGMDPEVTGLSTLEPGFDGKSYYPRQRTFLFGISATF
ncbi:MAG: SusC/RagA family TonB-linked outer membrane protein [Bacteroidales bacterium]|jgi:TonB-linked SusC/RagA family outer membrane protein|nr:SusC/RagA family TonB-linked outer membrane protein [Bacteroidales bacterium]